MSCTDFGGYHTSTVVPDAGAIAYAVIPVCPGFVPNQTDEDVVTGATSHELIEASTDPFGTMPAYAQADQNHEVWDMVLFERGRRPLRL